MTKTITTSELQGLRQSNADFLLLDVLSTEQFAKEHIEGAKNVPLDTPDFVLAVGRVAGNKSKKIVVYATNKTNDVSNRAAKQLVEAGHADVTAYEGSSGSWNHATKSTKTPAVIEPTAGAAKPVSAKATGDQAPGQSTCE